MPQLELEAANRTVVNVPRSFFCAHKLRGVKPTECQTCWLTAESFAASHTECIKLYRAIALAPFERHKLDPMENAVWDYLKACGKGIVNAKTSKEIRRALSDEGRGGYSISDDKLRQCVREMRGKGYLVVSSNIGKDAGFFIPVRNEEILNFLRTQASRREEILKSMKEVARFLHCAPEKLAELGLPAGEYLEGTR